MADSQADKTPVESHIIMKVDAPPEDSTKIENEENQETEDNILGIRPTQVCSPLLAKSLLSSEKFRSSSQPSTATMPKLATSMILRPPQLSANAASNSQKTPFSLNPSRLNPFAKVNADDNSNNCDASEHKDKEHSELNGDAPKFVPLLNTENKRSPNSSASTSNTTQASNFVFGQNIRDRVVSQNSSDDSNASSSCSNANGTSDMLFTSALKENPGSEGSNGTARKETKTLSESAREYEESRAVKRKYEEVEVKTGEEGETNVLQVSCKLFAYDKAAGGTWQERGRGTLRLNDHEAEDGSVHSRLVFRATGSLRLVLNTKVWADMSIQQASLKSVRFTAIDNNSGEIRVFLMMGNAEEMKQFYKHLEVRVKNEVETQKCSKTMPTTEDTSLKKLATDPGSDR